MSEYKGYFEGGEGRRNFPSDYDSHFYYGCGRNSTDKERKEAIKRKGKRVSGGRNNSPRTNRPRDNGNTNTARTMMTQAVATVQNSVCLLHG